GVDAKLARGSALTRPYAVCTVTVPKTARIAEHGRRLDAAVRRAGFAPLRLDLAHDVAVAASTVPLRVRLPHPGGSCPPAAPARRPGPPPLRRALPPAAPAAPPPPPPGVSLPPGVPSCPAVPRARKPKR